MKKVIDGDNMMLLENFEDGKQPEMIAKYEAKGFEDVSEDFDGDIVCYKEL